MKIGKIHDLLRIFVLSVISIALFSMAVLGVNHLAFAAATNRPRPLWLAVSPDPLLANAVISENTNLFRNITVIENSGHSPTMIPSYTITVDEAAQIGADYILAVFGVDVEGMYMRFDYGQSYGYARSYWNGNVAYTRDALESGGFGGDILFNFTVDSLTGQWIDIWQSGGRRLTQPELNRFGRTRNELVNVAWFEMDTNERIEFMNITPETLDYYTQKAEDLARRQFSGTSVVDVSLGGQGTDINILHIAEADGSERFTLESFTFIAVDETGREAVITVPAKDAVYSSVIILTMHNDIIPGVFDWVTDGLG
jgi:hypothetical protein